MRLAIVRIEASGRDGRARKLTFAHRDEPRTTSAAVVKSLGLEEGSEHDRDEFWHALEEAETACGKERAAAVLGYRERSTRELERRLIDDGYPAGVSRGIVTRFCELGLVDDERFAGMWARSKAAGGMGPKRIERELAGKGIAPLTIADAIEEVFGHADLIAEARASLRGHEPESAKERERLIRKLVRRGYPLGVAVAATKSQEHED